MGNGGSGSDAWRSLATPLVGPLNQQRQALGVRLVSAPRGARPGSINDATQRHAVRGHATAPRVAIVAKAYGSAAARKTDNRADGRRPPAR